jgi:hypothetical protein
MKPTIHQALRTVTRRRVALTLLVAAPIAMLLVAAPAFAGDVYSNIGPAPQVTGDGIFGRYPIANYQLDQYFSAISVGLTSGVDASGVAPMIASFFAQLLWLLTSWVAYGVITLFGFAFNLDLVNGNGSPGSGALTPVSEAIHNLYANTFGEPWLVAVIVLAGCWAMWKALVQRRYTETAGALAVSLLYCVLAIGIVTQPERTIGPTSKLSNQISTALLSLTNDGSLSNEQQAKSQASDQLFELLVLNPWTTLEFGGIEHCTTTSGGKTHSVAVRPLSAEPRMPGSLRSSKTARKSTQKARRASTTATSTRRTSSPTHTSHPAATPSTKRSNTAPTKTSQAQTPPRPTAATRSGRPMSLPPKRWARAANTNACCWRSSFSPGRSARSCCLVPSRSG